jgi:murein DD-endopeptidase MepM/ murein hydrolase activator NlpD
MRRLLAAGAVALLGAGALVGLFFVPDLFGGGDRSAPAAEDGDEERSLWDFDAGLELGAPSHEGPAPVGAEPVEVAAVVSETSLPGDGTRVVRHFGESHAFRSALVAAGASGEDADALITALADVMDFRRCRPEHELVFDRDGSGTLRRFEYRASTTQIYEARRDDEGGWVGSQVEVPIERVRIARAGTIRASLGTALERAGLGRSMVGVFVEVFENVINFNTDTRSGDTFRVIVDEERIGGELLRYGTVHAIEVEGSRLGHHQAFWYETREGSGDFYDETGRATHGGWLRTPLRYDHISSPFNPRRMHPILRRIVPHTGVDYSAGTGTPVWAAADGTVTFVGPRGANGNLVSLRHDNGYETHYAHLSRFASGLERNAAVRQRQAIGYVGSTGRSTGPHLHFGLKRNGRFVDPQAELNGPGRMMPAAHLARYRRHVREVRAELGHITIGAAPGPEAEEPEPPPSPPAGEVMD